MNTLDINETPSGFLNFTIGKIIPDCFSHLDINDQSIGEDNELKLCLNGSELGIVKVVAKRRFPLRDLSDMVAYLNSGKSHLALCHRLNSRYNGGNTLENSTQIMHLALQWVERNMQAQGPLLHDWWQSKNVKSFS